MRLFYLLISLALIAALVAPFFIEGPTGQPLMRVHDIVDDTLPVGDVTVYRWKDAHGVWQYGDEPPPGADAEAVDVSPKITRIETDWAAEWAARHPEAQGNDNAVPSPDGSIGQMGEIYDGKAMQKAERAAELMERRIHELKDVMEDVAESR